MNGLIKRQILCGRGVEDMLILKGNCGKSVVLNDLARCTDSICFEYYDMPVVHKNSIWVNSNYYSLIDLQGAIAEIMDENDYTYIYLIVYTNETEEDLKDFIKWLNDNEKMFRYRCENIIVACK